MCPVRNFVPFLRANWWSKEPPPDVQKSAGCEGADDGPALGCALRASALCAVGGPPGRRPGADDGRCRLRGALFGAAAEGKGNVAQPPPAVVRAAGPKGGTPEGRRATSCRQSDCAQDRPFDFAQGRRAMMVSWHVHSPGRSAKAARLGEGASRGHPHPALSHRGREGLVGRLDRPIVLRPAHRRQEQMPPTGPAVGPACGPAVSGRRGRSWAGSARRRRRRSSGRTRRTSGG